MFSNFFPKIMPFVRQHGKYGTANLATDDNAVTAHRLHMLDGT